MGVLGKGSYGTVLQAKCKLSKQIVAIKLVNNIFENEYSSTKVIREIKILRKLSQMENNNYTTKLIDLVLV